MVIGYSVSFVGAATGVELGPVAAAATAFDASTQTVYHYSVRWEPAVGTACARHRLPPNVPAPAPAERPGSHPGSGTAGDPRAGARTPRTRDETE